MYMPKYLQQWKRKGLLLVEIAEKVDSSQGAVAERICSMERARTLARYTALVDVSNVGCGYYHVIINFGSYNLKCDAKLKELCKNHANLLFTREVGAGNLSLGVEIASHDKFYEVIN